jgi:hypothetical protein
MPKRRFRPSSLFARHGVDAALRRYNRVFAFAALACALSACANILGIKDFTVDDAGSSAEDAALPIDGPFDTSLGADAADTHSPPADASRPTDSTQTDGSQSDAPSDVHGSDAPEGGPPDSASTCVPGGRCTPPTDCHDGTFVCGDAGAVCAATTAIADGTPCGTTAGFVCSGGNCVACNAGGDCSDAGAPCVRSTYACQTGVAVCAVAGNVADGTSCNGTMYCYSGTCSACTVNASCAPQTKPCDVGKVTSCAGGTMVCTDQGTAAAAGTACQTASVSSGVCDGQGNCVSCTPNASCSPGPCMSGTISCSTGPVCNPASNINEGMTCGSGSICVSGSCVACAGNCPNGCCNANGCVAAGAQTISNCGTGTSGGACQSCPAPSGSGTATCTGNACGYSCATGFHPCPPSTCADNTSPSTCGSSCGACPVNNDTPGCDGTNCTIQSCNANYADCNSNPNDGCEVDLQTSNTSCGSCGNACPTGGSCSSGSCTCPSGQANCSGTCINVSGTDGSNCGACGHNCMSGNCSGGKCQPWVVAQPSACPVDAATDGTNVVWLDSSAGVRQASAAGGGNPTTPATPSTLSMSTSGGFRRVAMANGVVAWIMGDPSGSQIDVWTATENTPNSGANITSMGSSTGAYGTLAFAINPSGGTAYTQLEDLLGGGLNGVESCGLGLGNSCSQLIANTPSDLGEDLAANGNYLFYTSHASGTVTRYAFSGGSSTTIASGQGAPFLLALDSNYVYWANLGTNAFSVNRTLQSTAGSSGVLPNTSGTVNRITTDGTYLYFGGISGTTKVGYVPVGSGATAAVTPLVIGSSGQATWAAAAGGAVYWCDSADNTIRGVRAPP